MCKEPPVCSRISFHVLSTFVKDGGLYIAIMDNQLKLEDQFKVLVIETIESIRDDKPYRITLVRCN